MQNLRILIADDHADDLSALVAGLEQGGAFVHLAENGEDALEKALSGEYDALVTELVLPQLGGKEIVQTLLQEYPSFPIVVFTRYGTMDDAFNLARMGVKVFARKDDNSDDLADKVLQVASGEEIDEAGEKAPFARKLPFSQYMSRNAQMTSIFNTAIERVAQAPSTVLITGESGTGKELLAKTIHHFSPRGDQPIVAVNCAALPETLIESELFGHEKGSFTGAINKRIGRFEQASGSTFFLDEVGDLSPVVQTKLLRVLQERTIERVGGNTPVPVDIRLVAATHRDLKKMVQEGDFREDLYYRLSVIHLQLPPLRERKEDIPGLAQFFLERYRDKIGRPDMSFSSYVVKAFQQYPWPGNVRELENVIEGAVVMSPGPRIELRDLREDFQNISEPQQDDLSLRDARASFEKDFIEKALRKHSGNVTATSDVLGIARKNLQEKIKRYNIEVDSIREES